MAKLTVKELLAERMPKKKEMKTCFICGNWVDHEEKNCPDRIQLS